MRAVGIDTSSLTGSAALLEDGRVAAEAVLEMERRHSELLTPALQSLFRWAGWEAISLDLVCVSAGPGAFTGIRIGFSCAVGMAYALDKPLVPVPSLDAAALRYRHLRRGARVLLDARRGQVYAGAYAPSETGSELERIGEIRCCSPLEACAGVESETLFVGSGAAVYRQEIEEALGGLAQFSADSPDWIAGSAVAELGVRAYERGPERYADLFSAAPLYARRPEAETRLD